MPQFLRTFAFLPLLAALLLAALLPRPSRAALPPLSPEELEKMATLIVQGVAKDVQVKSDGVGSSINWVYTVTLEVQEVAKGDAVKAGDEITIRCWNIARRPEGWAGPSGHGPIPAVGSAAKIWLREAEGKWTPLQPNGIELSAGAKRFAKPELKNSSSGIALALGGGLLVVLVIGVAVLAMTQGRAAGSGSGGDSAGGDSAGGDSAGGDSAGGGA